MPHSIDCVVCGSCVADVLVRPVPLREPIGENRLLPCDPIEFTTGGIVSNAGIALRRLEKTVAALTYVGADSWGAMVRARYESEGIDTDRLSVHPTEPTSTTAVLIDCEGERSFAHSQGAPRAMDRRMILDNLDLFAGSRMALFGYYSLMPNLQADLPEVLAAIRETGCQTALDAAGDGGTMEPLDRILPHLDLYVPSYREASHQTNESDPERIVARFRECSATGILGVKLGADGALLSDESGALIRIAPVSPPGPVVDTTGAGDSFYAGLIAGRLDGRSCSEAGRMAAAVGACCVTGIGASAGLRDLPTTCRLAGIDLP